MIPFVRNREEFEQHLLAVISGLLSSQNQRDITHHFHRIKTSHYSSEQFLIFSFLVNIFK